ncbi:formate dehydrogenase accessory sulfurtransferase FdhD [Nocardia alni]|uniref:formate dehydrogenase accessory sulfurtransferase FdhD n=1 Tax=Nocardia alni TaxID=2815723 RepID=UPI001C22503F|nr:formate dehydrogenase accessory sulfurtransferase FdhD [Nocardia alni]
MSRVTARRKMLRITADGQIQRPDSLAVEEPLELRVDGQSLTVTMRTPGSDIDLAHGFLLSENIIGAADDIVSARYCAGTDADGQNTYNVLDIQLRTSTPILARNFLTNSACGLCGKTALDEVRTHTRFPLPAVEPFVDTAVLATLPDELRSRQKVFEATGGLHAAGLFTPDGTAVAVREDIGRHNAVDKVLGWALREGRVPAHDLVLIVSSRASFELVQKAVMAGVPVLGAVSAPSSLAVDLAAESGLALVGFLRGQTMNIYAEPDRLRLPTPPARRPPSIDRPVPLTAHSG